MNAPGARSEFTLIGLRLPSGTAAPPKKDHDRQFGFDTFHRLIHAGRPLWSYICKLMASKNAADSRSIR